MNIQRLRFLLTIAAFLTAIGLSRADQFTKEEQALLDKNQFMEMYKPDEHSRHFIGNISATDPRTDKTQGMTTKSKAAVCFVFGMEDAKPARDEGRSMAECKYTPQQAHEFLFAEGWQKYHDRFFTRCYVQEGEAAYEAAVKAQQKPINPASTG
jgi:hypothetical protein